MPVGSCHVRIGHNTGPYNGSDVYKLTFANLPNFGNSSLSHLPDLCFCCALWAEMYNRRARWRRAGVLQATQMLLQPILRVQVPNIEALWSKHTIKSNFGFWNPQPQILGTWTFSCFLRVGLASQWQLRLGTWTHWEPNRTLPGTGDRSRQPEGFGNRQPGSRWDLNNPFP